MKRLICLILGAVLVFTLFGTFVSQAAMNLYYDGAWHTYTGNTFSLKIDGKKIDCVVPPIVFDGYSVVPARDVFEHLGATVSWEAKDQKVTVQLGKNKIVMYINSKTAYVNSAKKTMQIVPKIINEKTMIPVRFVGEALGYTVGFDNKTDTVTITTKTQTSTTPTTPSTSTTTVMLTSYKCAESSGIFTVTFHFSGSDIEHSAFLLTEPDRLVLDIGNVSKAATVLNSTPTSSIVTGVRFGQHDAVLRVVFDLSSAQKYDISRSDKVMTVRIGKVSGTQASTTPTTPTTPSTPEKPEEDKTPKFEQTIFIDPSRSITIDAGHGGSDPGAIFEEREEVEPLIGEDGEEIPQVGKLIATWKEEDINLAVALKVRDILEKNGVRVVMTRTKDETVVRRDRPELANSEETALFISIHTNSAANNPDATGIETWASEEVAISVGGVTDKSFAQNVQNAIISKTGAKNRGVKISEDLTVLLYSQMPSVLVEVGFISNEGERVKMFTESYRDKLAQGIAEGILKTFKDMGV